MDEFTKLFKKIVVNGVEQPNQVAILVNDDTRPMLDGYADYKTTCTVPLPFFDWLQTDEGRRLKEPFDRKFEQSLINQIEQEANS